MSHEIEGKSFAGIEAAWHNIGTVVPKGTKASEACVLAGADWLVEKRALFVADANGVPILAPERVGITRVTDNRVLGIVGKGYEPLQNRVSAGLFDQVEGVEWQACAVLKRGAVFTLSGQLSDVAIRRAYGGEEQVKRFLTIANWHDGTSRVRAFLSGILTVCNNTLCAGLAGADDSIAVRHTVNVEESVKAAVDALGLSVKNFGDALVQIEALDRVRLDASAVDGYFADVVADCLPLTTKERAVEIIGELRNLFHNGAGLRGETAYDAYQAVTDYVSHARKVGARAKAAHEAAERRAEDMLFGQGRRALRRALKLATRFIS